MSEGSLKVDSIFEHITAGTKAGPPLVQSQDMRATPRRVAHRGLLITLSGADGSGKSTQARLLLAHLESQGRESEIWKYDAERSGILGRGIGRMSRDILPRCDQEFERDVALLMGADIVNFLWGPVMERMETGMAVIMDRYTWDFFITVRTVFGVSDSRLTKLMSSAPKPDFCYVLVVPAEVAVTRIGDRAFTRHPLESPEAIVRKCDAYEVLARSPSIHAVDGNVDRSEVHNNIVANLEGMKE